MEPRVLELFAGIGGAALAFQGIGKVAAAIDINQNAKQVYQQNFSHPYLTRSIEDLSTEEFLECGANTWWVSAPCQPYTRRGKQLGEQDNRSRALHHLIAILGDVKPTCFLLENVIGFRGSHSHQKLLSRLEDLGYQVAEHECCPTDLGIPNRRPRYYLAATTDSSLEPDGLRMPRKAIAQIVGDFIDDSSPGEFELGEEEYEKYVQGLNIVTPESRTSTCFTSAYGRSLTKSGSYLQQGDRKVRRFSPLEVSRFLGFQESTGSQSFFFPETLDARQLWKLLGNSISVTIVREILSQLFRRDKMEQLNQSENAEKSQAN